MIKPHKIKGLAPLICYKKLIIKIKDLTLFSLLNRIDIGGWLHAIVMYKIIGNYIFFKSFSLPYDYYTLFF